MSRFLKVLFAGACLCIGGPACSAVPAPPAAPPEPPTEAELSCFFDGGCGGVPLAEPPPAVSGGQAHKTSTGPVLRPDELPLPPAPRYALDLAAVPERFRLLIPDFERMPHKNQEETPEWVEHINALIRGKNARTPGSRILEWKYDGRSNEPPFACLSYGISSAMDWWSLQCGTELPSYASSIHGRTERGWDPRTFELEYFYRASFGDPRYALFSQQLPIERDPVRSIAAPFSPLGYAEMALESRPYANPDPYTDRVYRFDAPKNPMEGQYVQLFSNRILRSKTPDGNAKILAEAIGKWGIAYIQLEQTKRPRMFGAHSVVVVGYFCMQGEGNFLDCKSNADDAAWGRTAYFVVHDSFGDFPADKVRDASGGAAYRAVRIESIDEAYSFPHSLSISAVLVPGAADRWRLAVTNRCGRPVPAGSVKVAGGAISPAADGSFELAAAPGSKVKLEAAVPFYYEADGQPRVFSLNLTPNAVSTATEEVRTRERPGFYERRNGK